MCIVCVQDVARLSPPRYDQNLIIAIIFDWLLEREVQFATMFSFLKLRKAKDNDTTSSQSSRGKKFGLMFGKKAATERTKRPVVGIKKAVSTSGRRKNGAETFHSPMAAIETDIPETIGTDLTVPLTPSTPVMEDLSIVDYGGDNEGAEIVLGPVSNLTDIPEIPNRGGSADQVSTNVKDMVKRQLFEADGPNFVPDEPVEDGQPGALGEQLPNTDAEIDEPFDEKEMKKEDPYILEVLQSESNPASWKVAAENVNVRLSPPRPVTIKEDTPEIVTKEALDQDPTISDIGVVSGFLELFKCGDVTTSLFYDTLCAAGPTVKKRKRPYFNELFALNFILVCLLHASLCDF